MKELTVFQQAVIMLLTKIYNAVRGEGSPPIYLDQFEVTPGDPPLPPVVRLRNDD